MKLFLRRPLGLVAVLTIREQFSGSFANPPVAGVPFILLTLSPAAIELAEREIFWHVGDDGALYESNQPPEVPSHGMWFRHSATPHSIDPPWLRRDGSSRFPSSSTDSQTWTLRAGYGKAPRVSMRVEVFASSEESVGHLYVRMAAGSSTRAAGEPDAG